MLGMSNQSDISGSIEIREVEIAGVACINTACCISDEQNYVSFFFFHF